MTNPPIESPNPRGGNETVTLTIEEEKIQSLKAVKQWNEIMQGSSSEGRNESTSKGRKSWADQVEEEESIEKKTSVWDNFDITKISNAGFKLEYVSSIVQGDSNIVELELEDIESEVEYWKNVVVCYILGAYPPFAIIKGYVQRLWGKYGLNKIVMLKNGIVLVRFDTELGKNDVVQGSIYHFDNKPFIVKA